MTAILTEAPALLEEARAAYRLWRTEGRGALPAETTARVQAALRTTEARRELAEALGATVEGNRAVLLGACPWCAGRVRWLIDCRRDWWASCWWRESCGWWGGLEVLVWWPLRRKATRGRA